MASTTLQNFKFGWDVRRSELTSQPGTLLQLIDAHVNEGAEIEKRFPYEFVGQLGADCVGLEEYGSNLCTFSLASNSIMTSPLDGTFIQRIKLTDYSSALLTIIGAGSDANVVINSVPFSLNFNGQPFAAVLFYTKASGGAVLNQFFTQLFYGATPVKPSVNGLILSSTAALGTLNIYKNVGASLLYAVPTGWTADSWATFVASYDNTNYYLNITTPFNINSVAVSVNTTSFNSPATWLTVAKTDATHFKISVKVPLGGPYPDWKQGDTWTIVVTDTNGNAYTYGAGNLANVAFSCGLGMGSRAYVGGASGSGAGTVGLADPRATGQGQLVFSALNDATRWEQQDIGAGTITLLSQNDNTVRALAPFQGRLGVFQRYCIQLWTIDADPTKFALAQQMNNTGTPNALSVQPVGDLDVIYLDDAGFRSLQVQVATLNALSNDIGSPVNSVLRTLISQNGGADGVFANACSIIEPSTKRFFGYIDVSGQIFVLSKFAASKVLAWSQYSSKGYLPSAALNPGFANYPAPAPHQVDVPLLPYTWYLWNPGVDELNAYVVNSQGQYQITDVGSDRTGNVPQMFYTSASPGDGAGLPDPNSYVLRLQGSAGGVAYTGKLQKLAVSPFGVRKFVLHKSQVYMLVTDLVHYYVFRLALAMDSRQGGWSSVTALQSKVQIPWLDLKRPTVEKVGTGMDLIIAGAWKLQASMDYNDFNGNPDGMPVVFNGVGPTSDNGRQSFGDTGTHFTAYLTSQDQNAATLSALILQFNEGAEK